MASWRVLEGVLKPHPEIGDSPKNVQSNPPKDSIKPLKRFYPTPRAASSGAGNVRRWAVMELQQYLTAMRRLGECSVLGLACDAKRLGDPAEKTEVFSISAPDKEIATHGMSRDGFRGLLLCFNFPAIPQSHWPHTHRVSLDQQSTFSTLTKSGMTASNAKQWTGWDGQCATLPHRLPQMQHHSRITH